MHVPKIKYTTALQAQTLERLNTMATELDKSKAEILEIAIQHYYKHRFPSVLKNYQVRLKNLWLSKFSSELTK